jgi:hypothetical protein
MSKRVSAIQVAFGVILKKRAKTILFLERRGDGLWALPCVEVGDVEYPHEALERLGQELFGGRRSDLDACEQIGPEFVLPDGRKAVALICCADKFELNHPDYAQCAFFSANDLLTSVLIDARCERQAWDGFSIMEVPRILSAQTGGVEPIYCDPGKEHILVDESRGVRREWPRLNPKDGRPMAAAS